MNNWKVATIILIVVLAGTLVYFIGFSQSGSTALFKSQESVSLTDTSQGLYPAKNIDDFTVEDREMLIENATHAKNVSREDYEAFAEAMNRLVASDAFGDNGEVNPDGFWSDLGFWLAVWWCCDITYCNSFDCDFSFW